MANDEHVALLKQGVEVQRRPARSGRVNGGSAEQLHLYPRSD